MPEGLFVTSQDVRRMLEELSPQEREALLTEQIKNLSPETKLRVLGLSESGLTLVTGSFICLNSEVAINIQDTSGFDPEKILEALVDYRRAQREKNS
ncbi:hypothetical protein [Richelia sinica]|uniref:hypothetical protein n=1 Tax=Richelia sinica TaxID=1357545 RepID=UPI0016862FE7|nr:hypothetical protein [Richelia sinica]MBD2666689.1 hypothetical protein [Richelia sinica FACHB-800]